MNTGVAIFVYNRPEHTKRLFKSILAARSSAVYPYYVFSDGPKSDDVSAIRKVNAVRSVCSEFSKKMPMNLVYSEVSRGLATSIVNGVNHILRDHEQIIVLEDDLILQSGFFEFMGKMLARFADVEEVFHISGYMIPTRRNLPPIGLFRMPGSWGWATWRRAWAHYDNDASRLVRLVESKGVNAFNVDGSFDHFETLCENERGDRSTWAVRWYASMFLKGGLSLYPSITLVENYGFDGSGTNCGKDGSMKSSRKKKNGELWKKSSLIDISESEAYLEAYRQFYTDLIRRWTTPRLLDRISGRVRNLLQRGTNT